MKLLFALIQNLTVAVHELTQEIKIMSATAQALTDATNALVATVQEAVTLMGTLLADLQAAQSSGDQAAEQAATAALVTANANLQAAITADQPAPAKAP